MWHVWDALARGAIDFALGKVKPNSCYLSGVGYTSSSFTECVNTTHPIVCVSLGVDICVDKGYCVVFFFVFW